MKIKYIFILISSFLVLSGKVEDTNVKTEPDAFYVWQRDWDKDVSAAVEQENGLKKLYFLAGEFNKKPVRINPDWKTLSKKRVEPIPVYRVHHRSNWLEKDQDKMLLWISTEFKDIAQKAELSNCKIKEIQLDIDCPERLLPEYLEFIRKVKKKIPSSGISITALPCHLDNTSFTSISELVDEYILQVHGLEYPRHISDDVSIMRKSVTMSSIKKAERIGRPFKVALPTYGYELFFKKESGKFCGIAAENETGLENSKRIVSRFIVPDPSLVMKARKLALKSSTCTGVIWFRLPIKGDTCSWDRKTVAQIQKNTLPEISIETEWREKSEGFYELVLHNKGAIGRKTECLKLTWEDNSVCNFGLYPGSSNKSEGTFSLSPPKKIICTSPNPGCEKPVAWFRNLEKSPEIIMEKN